MYCAVYEVNSEKELKKSIRNSKSLQIDRRKTNNNTKFEHLESIYTTTEKNKSDNNKNKGLNYL